MYCLQATSQSWLLLLEITFPFLATLSARGSCYYSCSILTVHEPFPPPEIQALSKPITTATMELYQRIVRDLPPTPSKFHYIFNLRDLSRIYHGLSQTIPERFDTPGFFVRVWRNECLRVFYDRLTTDKDHTLVSDHISELLQQHFSGHAEVCIYIYIYVYRYVCGDVFPGIHMHSIF